MGRKRFRIGEDRKIFQSLSLIMQFGLYMLVPIAMMGGLGYYLDRKLGTHWITIVLCIVGAIAGFQNIYHEDHRTAPPGTGGADGEKREGWQER